MLKYNHAVNQGLVFTLMAAVSYPFTSLHRFAEPFVSCSVSSGGGTLRGVGHQLHPSPWTHLYMDHPGTHLVAGWYDNSTHNYNTIFKNLDSLIFTFSCTLWVASCNPSHWVNLLPNGGNSGHIQYLLTLSWKNWLWGNVLLKTNDRQ